MNIKQSQTARCSKKIINSKNHQKSYKIIRSTSNSSRKPSRISSKKVFTTTQSHLSTKISRKEHGCDKTLKNQFDQLVNSIFLKIDFDCSGFITFTKVGYCKDIPQRIFYFFGGVFQKVKQLGGVVFTIFSKMCQQAYLQAKKEDLQAILAINLHQSAKSHKKDKFLPFKEVKDQNFKKLQYDDIPNLIQSKQNFLSTKKIDRSFVQKSKISLKIKTQVDDDNKSTMISPHKQNLSRIYEIEYSNRDISQNEQTCKSFQSDKIRILNEILNRQIKQSQNRLLGINQKAK